MNLDFEQIAENNLGEMIIICVFAIKYLRRKRQRRWICSLESMQNLRKTTKRVFYTLLYIAQATKILLRFAHQVYFYVPAKQMFDMLGFDYEHNLQDSFLGASGWA